MEEIKVGDAVIVQYRGHSMKAKVIAIKGAKAQVSFVYSSSRGNSMSFQVCEPWRPLDSLGRVKGHAPDSQAIMRGLMGLPEPQKAEGG